MYGVFAFDRVGSSVTAGVEYIENYRPLGSVSGTLALQLWATDLPYTGGLLVGYKLCEIPLGTLLGGYYLHNVVRSSSFAAPPDGNYNIVFVLAEWQGFSFATVDWANFSVRQNFGLPPEIVSAPSTVGDVASPFYFQVLAIHNPQAFAASGLPPGLTINQYTGVISGTPTTAGIYSVGLGVANSIGTGGSTLTITVRPHIPTITSSGTASGQVGTPFDYQITADYGPTSFGTAEPLPQGLTINTTTGRITGTPSSFGIFNVTLKAGNGGGVASQTLVLTILPSPPSIATQPQSRTVTAGNSVTFGVLATSIAPVSYQWYFNDSPISGATTSSYSLASVQQGDAGNYRVQIRNSGGSVDSVVATLAVEADTVTPAAVISSPAAGTKFTNSSITLFGTASDNVGVVTVEYRLENSDGISAYRLATGASNWSATVTGLSPGTNTVLVRACDASGNCSVEVTRSFTYVLLSPLIVTVTGLGYVVPNLDGQRLQVGKTYTLTAVPATGQVFSNWTGGVHANAVKVAFVMQTNLVLIANFIPNPFIPAKGSYNGLVYATNSVAHESSGFLSLMLNERGSFSAQMQMAGKRHSFTGHFDLLGKATNTLKRPGTNDLFIELAAGLSTGSYQITGQVTDGYWAAALLAHRAAVYVAPNTSAYQGKHTLLIPGGDDSSANPGGDGYGTVTISQGGRLSLRGMLADGTPVTQSVPVTRDGHWPLYVSLYGGKGSMLGWVTADDAPPPVDSLSGRLSWIKPSLYGVKYYPTGFSNVVSLVGSTYLQSGTNQVLALTNAAVICSGGNLTRQFTNEVILASKNKVANLSSNSLVLTINDSSGIFIGTVTPPGTTRAIPIKGAVLQRRNYAAGFFLGTNQSGQVYFGALEP